MAHSRCWLILLLLVCWPLVAMGQGTPQQEVVLIYKDGFALKGRIHEKSSVIYDSASGKAFPLFSGNFYIDDHVRNILFSRGQIQQVTQIKPAETMSLVRFKSVPQTRDIHPRWEFEGFSKWNEKGERTATFSANAPLEMLQRVGMLTPHHIFVVTNDYRWDMKYFTQEFGPALTRSILFNTYHEKREFKEMKDSKKLLEIANFLREVGWFAEAEQEIDRCITNFPHDRKMAQAALESLKKTRTTLFVESIDQAASIGQHQVAIDRLSTYDQEEYQKLVSAKHRQMAQDLKTKYDNLKTDMEQARIYLKELPVLTGSPRSWTRACEFIEDELNYDTADRLETFLKFAEQFEMRRKEKRKPTQTAEEVLAMAVSGWLQGKTLAEPDPKTALKLSCTRQFLLDYMRAEDTQARTALMSTFRRENDLQVDVIARLIRMIPPVQALDAKQISTEVITMKIEAPETGGGSYLLQLPLDYHPLREYPVLLLLNSSRDKTEEHLKRFSTEAAKYGYILAAPDWSVKGVGKGKYQYSAREHALVLDTLRDLRRRFQIDSDRVFLFGWEDGANMALDVGLGHPDLFAGVVPMNVALPTFTRRFYWPNAQYLPFYIIDGERTGTSSKIRDLFKDWSRDPYMATYVEYRGRASEWYSAEVPFVMDWMSRKKRHHPMKEVGRYNPRGGLGEEFRSTRSFDNRFYWLSTDAIADRCQNSHTLTGWSPNFQPATFQAQLTIGNKVNSKKEAEVWNQLDVRVSGVKQVTIWLTANLMDLEKPLQIRVNGENVGTKRNFQPSLETLLEELYSSGDRQRLFVGKVEVNLSRLANLQRFAPAAGMGRTP